MQITGMKSTAAMHIGLGAMLVSGFVIGGSASALADDAYIAQATAGSYSPPLARQFVQSASTLPASRAPRSVALVPTPEAARPSHANTNFAATIEAGRLNNVAQFQAGRNNFSNVGVVGGSGNNVGVWQSGSDFSNLYLVNTKGMSVGVLQPIGAAPLNMLIARLPNGSLLIKR